MLIYSDIHFTCLGSAYDIISDLNSSDEERWKGWREEGKLISLGRDTNQCELARQVASMQPIILASSGCIFNSKNKYFWPHCVCYLILISYLQNCCIKAIPHVSIYWILAWLSVIAGPVAEVTFSCNLFTSSVNIRFVLSLILLLIINYENWFTRAIIPMLDTFQNGYIIIESYIMQLASPSGSLYNIVILEDHVTRAQIVPILCLKYSFYP